MVKENGAVLRGHLAIFTMESIKTIVSMASVASFGQAVINIKVSISKTIDTATEKCAGLMALGTRENGIEASNTDMAR